MGATSIALYLSISAYTLIPVSVYWMFPTLSVIGVCFLEVLLIPFIYMSEESTVIIQRLKILPATMPQFVATQRFDHRKLGRKRIRTMRPFVVYAGLWDYRFHKLGKSTKSTIIEKISSFTISALLAKRN